MQNSTEKNLIEIVNSGSHYFINMKVNPRIIDKFKKIEQKIKSISEPEHSVRLFNNFEERGICPQITFSFTQESNLIRVKILKSYFFYVLNQREFELLIISKHMLHVWEDFIQQIHSFVKYVDENRNLIRVNQIVEIDLISITIKKTFETRTHDGINAQRTIFLRQSCFQFKKNLAYYRYSERQNRSKQSDHLFSFAEVNEEGRLPTPSDFYSKPRLNFIDDLHSNQSLLKRFAQRFLTIYLPFCLSIGQIAAETPEKREFYKKVYTTSYFYAIRLKKFGFIFPMQRMVKEGNKQKIKTIKISIYFYCQEETNNGNQNFSIFVESMFPEVSEKFANEAFILRMLNLNENDKKRYSQIQRAQNKLYLHPPKNEQIYCKILAEFTFFLDRIFFLMMDQNKDLKKRLMNDDQKQMFTKLSLEEEVFPLKLPPTESYYIKKSKYIHYYQLQFKSKRQVLMSEENNPQKDTFLYSHELLDIKMFRKKKTDNTERNQPDNIVQFFQKPPQGGSNFSKGLKQYLHKVINNWNLRDIFQEVSDFTGSIMEIVVDKVSEKSQLKSFSKWVSIITGIDTLLLSLCELFFTNTTAIRLTVLSEQTDETNTGSDFDEKLVVGQLTFGYYELRRGWYEAIPPCIYYIRIFKHVIEFGRDDYKNRVKIGIDGGKKMFKEKIKQYMLETNDHKIQYPFA